MVLVAAKKIAAGRTSQFQSFFNYTLNHNGDVVFKRLASNASADDKDKIWYSSRRLMLIQRLKILISEGGIPICLKNG